MLICVISREGTAEQSGAVQCSGANGYLDDLPAGRRRRDTKLPKIGERQAEHKECTLVTGQNYRGFEANQRGLGQIPGKYYGELKKRPLYESGEKCDGRESHHHGCSGSRLP